MLSGEEEEEEEREGGMGGRRRGGEQGPASDEEGGSEDEEGGWSDEELQAGGLGQRNLLAESESEEEGEGEALSAHELRQQRMADRIRWVAQWVGGRVRVVRAWQLLAWVAWRACQLGWLPPETFCPPPAGGWRRRRWARRSGSCRARWTQVRGEG